MPNTTTRQRDSADPLDVRYMAQGQLFRAIVTLPQHLCPRSEPLHERIVFLDAPTHSHAVQRLTHLLDAAWSVESENWFDDGLAYNLQAWLQEQAESALRSLTAEVVLRLEESRKQQQEAKGNQQ